MADVGIREQRARNNHVNVCPRKASSTGECGQVSLQAERGGQGPLCIPRWIQEHLSAPCAPQTQAALSHNVVPKSWGSLHLSKAGCSEDEELGIYLQGCHRGIEQAQALGKKGESAAWES